MTPSLYYLVPKDINWYNSSQMDYKIKNKTISLYLKEASKVNLRYPVVDEPKIISDCQMYVMSCELLPVPNIIK